jgi:hypothetical protein
MRKLTIFYFILDKPIVANLNFIWQLKSATVQEKEEEHLFRFSLVIEGATEEVLERIMPQMLM